MNTLDTLFSRRSIRSYTGEQLSGEELATILKAANASPIARGIYADVHLTVVQDAAMLEQIDRAGARFFGNPDIHPLFGAPTLIVVSARKPQPGRENIAYSNAAIVLHNMCLAATELGLGQCCIWGATAAMSADAALVDALQLPQDFIPCCSVTLGKTAEHYALREIPEARIGCNVLK